MRKPTLTRRVAPVALLAATALVLTACGGSDTDDAASTIVRSTTNVAGAGVLGNDRDTENVCGPTAPVDPAGVTGTVRKVTHAAGETEVPAEPCPLHSPYGRVQWRATTAVRKGPRSTSRRWPQASPAAPGMPSRPGSGSRKGRRRGRGGSRSAPIARPRRPSSWRRGPCR